MGPGGNGTITSAERDEALAALRAQWKHAYDVGIVTITDKLGPIPLWVAIRLEGEKPEPLIGLTPEALEAAIRDDWGEQP